MTTTTKTKLLTADDLLRLYSKGVRGELIRGVLCETMAAGGEHGEIVVNLGIILGGFVKPRRLGRLAASDAGVLLERNPATVREPDLAFISSQKLPLNVRNPGYYEVVPDLVVEIASPSDSRREVNDKARMWHSHGVRLVCHRICRDSVEKTIPWRAFCTATRTCRRTLSEGRHKLRYWPEV